MTEQVVRSALIAVTVGCPAVHSQIKGEFNLKQTINK